MYSVNRLVHADPAQVWSVLSDGWLYPVWVVGASRMREVDDTWPAVGSSLHHSVGAWPALIDDRTEVLAAVEREHLLLTARGWPLGEARVALTLEPDAAGTRVTIAEDAVAGPGTLVPGLARRPGITWRNTETLRRLAYLAERRT